MKNKSREISYLLRHNPQDLKIDKEGWVSVNDLLDKLQISFNDLEYIVDNNDKKRFSFNTDKTLIRANQGHSKSLNINITYKKIKFPTYYYHGTALYNLQSILNKGLISQSRSHVHLSKDEETAYKVGMRHAKRERNLVILKVDGLKMSLKGFDLFESDNNVILTDKVPKEFISVYKKFN
ncbi:MAG: RNA 2'-phosphotransferase [Nanoarchaeota archaeon]